MRILLRDLSPSTQYVLQARTSNDQHSSEWSRKFDLQTTIDTMPPETPTNPVISTAGVTAMLSWDAVTTNDDGSAITDLTTYRITVNSPDKAGAFVKDVGLSTNFEFTLAINTKTFVTPQRRLTFTVSAIDAVGNASPVAASAIASFPVIGNVTGLVAETSLGAVSLKWNEVSSPALAGYKVYEGKTSGFALGTPEYQGTGAAFMHISTETSVDHYYKVYAYDVFGQSSAAAALVGPVRPEAPFTLDKTAPTIPTGLTAVISGKKMTVSWSEVVVSDLRYYVVEYRQVGVTEWSFTNVTYDTLTTVIDVVEGINYEVRVRAVDFSGNFSGRSAIVTTTTATVNTAPAVPTGLTVIPGRDSLQISWAENTESDMKGNVGTYDVTIATNSAFTTGVLQYKTGALTLSVNGLNPATAYWVRVRATDSGTPPLSSAYSASKTATTSSYPVTPLSDGVPPASSPVATLTGGFGYIHASWTPIANNDIVTYEVHLGTTTSFTPSVSTKVGEVSGSTLVIENTAAGAALAYSTDYYVKIIAKDRDGAAAAGAASNAVQVSKVASTDTTITPGQIGAATPGDVQGAKDYSDTKYATALKNTLVEYAVNSSETVAPTTGWSSTTPTRTPGAFIWFRTVLTYGDNTTSTLTPALLTGNTGATGTTGTPAAYITLTATTQVLTSPATGGVTSPTTSVITGVATNTTITAWTYSVNGAAFTTTVPAGAVRSGNSVTITGSTMTAKTITVKMSDAGTASDTITVAKVMDGAVGSTGTPGSNGSDGAPGADAYTVLLSNEAQVFAGSTTAALAGSATSSVIAYKGSTQSVATIGTITGQVTGLTTAITNNGTNNATVTVTVTTSLTALNGILTIPVTVDGKVFNKTFSWSVSRQGSQGIQGNPGTDGVTTYTWLKYADTPTTGMSDSPTGKTYMGIATNKTTSTESSTYSDYTWSLIKGADGSDGSPGVPGTPGADGVTTYTWVKYATSAAGAGLSDDPTGKTYIGLAFNKTTATESTTPGDYQWSLIQGPQGDTGNTGAPGTPAEMVYLTATTQVLTSPATGGATSPTTAVVTGASVNGAITVWQYSTNGAAFTNTLPAGVTRSGNVVTITGSTVTANTITVRMATSSGVSDTLTVAKVSNGAQGATGNTGSPGSAGADAYTVILSNEAHSFAGSTTAALAGSTTSTVIAYKGSAQQSATVGTITGQVTGLTTSIASNNTTAPVITVTVTTALTTRNGTLNVPVTVDGKVFTKTIAWAVAYAGATGSTGSPGTPGSNGISVTSVTPYFQTVTKGTAAPAVPTTMTPPGPWSATEPNYATNTELYRTDRVVYSNSTFSYSAVTKVASYAGLEAVTADAQVKANAAKDAAIAGAEASRKADFGYLYKADITIGGDHDKYYPVLMLGGDQNVKRELLVKRAYNELHPPEWSSATHGGGLTLKIKWNYGGWGGAAYSWEVHELEEMYNPTFGYAMAGQPSGMGGYIFLRGGGAIYHLYSDQPLTDAHPIGLYDAATDTTTPLTLPAVFTTPATLAYSTNLAYKWPTPAPRTEVATEEIRVRKFITLAREADQAANNITSTQITDYAITTPKIATDAIDARTVVAGAIGTVALAAEAVDATKIKANSIFAKHMTIADTSNMATVNESVPGNGNYGVSKNIIANGWSTRDRNDNIYFMFREQTGPLPFKTGDRIRLSFEAYADLAVSAQGYLWLYGNTSANQGFPSAAITTSAKKFDWEITVTVDTNLKTAFLIGLTGVTGRNVFVRNVRAYVMNAGELIVDGTIHGNKMITNTLDANVIKTSTLTSTTITLGAGGIIKSATGGFQITDSGITIPLGTIDANILKANTSFITTLNVGAGGSIQSTGYTSGGTSGFSLSSSGLTIKGTNNTVDGGTIPTSTLDVNSIKTSSLTATTISLGSNGNISVGVGGKITVDGSTGSIQSNNYSGTTTGWGLGPSGLVINEGSIDAKSLRTNTAIVGDLTIGQASGTPGSIKSFGYVANSTGFKLDKTGLEINSGSIAASTLKLQNGQNVIPPAYADFEFASSFYTQGKGMHTFFANVSKDLTQKKFSDASLKVVWGGNSGAEVWFGANNTDYNINIDPTEKQIVSFWVNQSGTFPVAFFMKFETGTGSTSTIVTSANLTTPTGWGRLSAVITPPVGATGKAIAGMASRGTSNGLPTYIDGVQIEAKTGALDTPSPWMPSAATSIDGGMIKTNTITTEQIATGAITAASGIIADLAVTNAKIADISATKITAGRIDAALEISTLSGKIIAGNPLGANVTIAQNGIDLSVAGLSGNAYPAVSIRTNRIAFGVLGPDGSKLGGINSDGSISSPRGSFREGLNLKSTPLIGKADGNDIPGWFDNFARGIIAIRDIPSDRIGSRRGSGVEIPSYYLTANLRGGRRYRVVVSARFQGYVVGGVIVMRIRYNTGNTIPSITSPELGYPADATLATTTHAPTIQVEGIYEAPTSRKATFRMSFQGFYNAEPRRTGGRLYVEDMGPLIPASAGIGTGVDADDGAGTSTFETEWKATDSKGYDKNGVFIAGSTGKVSTWFWGATPVTYNSAAWVYNGNSVASSDSTEGNKTITSALTGATLQKAEVYVRNMVWYSGSSGVEIPTGMIALNELGAATLPTSKVVTPGNYIGANPARGVVYDELVEAEGVWIEVPVEWFSGTNRGITLGSSTSLSSSVDGLRPLTSGEFHGIANEDPPRLRLTYTKAV